MALRTTYPLSIVQTQSLISSVPSNRPTEPLTVFTIVDNNFLNDAFLDNSSLGRGTWIAIFSSFSKIISFGGEGA